MGHKRPFGINVEDKRILTIGKIVSFGKSITKFVRKYSGEGYWINSFYYVHKFTCSVCGKSESWRTNDGWSEGVDKQGELTEVRYYELAYYLLSHHIKPQIRMYGCKKHMQLILDIFGQKQGIQILDIFAKKNLLVAQSICEFIKSKVPIPEDKSRGVKK